MTAFVFRHKVILAAFLRLILRSTKISVYGYEQIEIYESNLTNGTTEIQGRIESVDLVIYRFAYVMAPFLRIRSEANATGRGHPLFLNIRELDQQVSWKLPSNKISYGSFLARFSKTVCTYDQRMVLELSTFSEAPIDYCLQLDGVDSYSIELDQWREEAIRPQEPRYAHFKFPPGLDVAVLKAYQSDLEDICVRVIVQSHTCAPNNQTDHNTQRISYFTMTTRGALSIHADEFSEFDLVFEMSDISDHCWETLAASRNVSVMDVGELATNLTFYLEALDTSRYWGMLWYVLIVLLLGSTVMITCTVSRIRTVLLFPSKRHLSKTLPKAQNPQYSTGSFLFNLIIIAVFYMLPTVQLLFTFFLKTRLEPNRDACYFNFFCANPLGPFVAFNAIYSNVGYVLFGIFFILIVRWHSKRFAWRHVEVFYSMGVALILEGFLSAGYHICPTENNFQFDTTFMYGIAGLCIYHLYQIRNPANPGHPYKFYGIFALAIVFTVCGVVNKQRSAVWTVVVAVVYLLVALLVGSLVMRLLYWKNQVARKHPTCRKVMCGIQAVLNLAVVAYGTYALLKEPNRFPTVLLYTCIANLALFTIFYFVIKIIGKELIVAAPLICAVLALISWGISLYFYSDEAADWKLSPAKSRSLNKDCVLLRFFDNHDVWHFMSSVSLFLSFLLLLTLDDGQDVREDVGVVRHVTVNRDPETEGTNL